MNVLIFLAHGSRLRKSSDEVKTIAGELRAALSDRFDRVEEAYLEIAAPAFEQVIEEALAGGAERIVVYPYFLNSGRHVDKDIPAIVERFRRAHPECVLEVMPHFGQGSEIKDLILSQILSE